LYQTGVYGCYYNMTTYYLHESIKKRIFSIALFLDITAYTNVFTCFIFCKKSSKCFKQHYCILF